MQKYVIYDNNNNIYDIADTQEKIKEMWNLSKSARVIATSIDKNKKYYMGIADLSQDEINSFETSMNS